MKPGIAIATYLSVTQSDTSGQIREEQERARKPEAPETVVERQSPPRRLLRALRGATA
ncbi:MAG TPA: hypothetical protein VG479_00175 [Gaiellaceae bacterium]|jgi:hypothetical protein|nr:hypothetical protein [Gaiellaceae bacterium]